MPSFFLRIRRFSAFVLWCSYRAARSAYPVTRKGWTGVSNASSETSIWAEGLVKILNVKIRVVGDPSSVRGGLIVSNHQSYIDIIVHSSVFNVRFSPKHDIKKWPGIGLLVAMNRPVWVDRSSKQASKRTLAEFRETMDNGINLLVYPEGTTSDLRAGLLPFKSTPFEAVTGESAPIFPVLTVYRQKQGMPRVSWVGDDNFLPHLWALLGAPSIEVEIHVLDAMKAGDDDRKRLAKRVHGCMDAKLRALCSEVHIQ